MQRGMKPGDAIVFARSDGRYDVLKIDSHGERTVIRSGFIDLNDAYVIARNHAARDGSIWISMMTHPRWSRPKTTLH